MSRNCVFRYSTNDFTNSTGPTGPTGLTGPTGFT